MKAGWKTSEFWLALVGPTLTALVLFGLISTETHKTLEAALGEIIVGIVGAASSAFVAIRYIAARESLKLAAKNEAHELAEQEKYKASANGVLPLFLLALVGALSVASPLPAQSPPAPVVKYSALLPWRRMVEREQDRLHQERDRAPQTDPALLSALQKLADNQALMMQLLQRDSAPRALPPATPPGSPPAGPPAPLVEKHHYYYLPIAGEPKDRFPIEGIPKDKLPIPGVPKDKLPIEGIPKDKLPIEGEPKDKLPSAPPTMPPAPLSYQRFTIHSGRWIPVNP